MIRVVLSDLDGTLLEPDGSVLPEARSVLGAAVRAGVPVCPVTSKTVPELRALRRYLELADPAGFENGAGVLDSQEEVHLLAAAVPLRDLVGVMEDLRRHTGAPLRGLHELSDEELAALTALPGSALEAVRQRQATLPVVVDPAWDEQLNEALPECPSLRLVRGNRFLHLQGFHDKADVTDMILDLLGGRPGTVVALGDAPNDAGLLAVADLAVVIPSTQGPHPGLVARFPGALVAPRPHGLGWADVVGALLDARKS